MHASLSERLICLLVTVLFVGGCGLFVYAKTSWYEQGMSVVSLDWQHIQPVEVFKTLHKNTYRSQMPADAFNIHRYEDCTSKYDSKGNYAGQDCDDMARYDINRWTWDYDLVTSGLPADEMIWPEFTADPVEQLGSHRPAARREILAVRLVTPVKKPYTYIAPDLAMWRTFAAGQSYKVQVNRMEEAIWDTLKLVDAR